MSLNIFHTGPAPENMRRLRRLAEHFGIETELTDVSNSQSLLEAIRKAIGQGDEGLVLDVESLQSYASRQDELEQLTELLTTLSVPALLLATDNHELTNRFLRTLTGGRVLKVERKDCATSIKFPVSGHVLNGELSSYTYAREAKEALTLAMVEDAEALLVMELDASPAFACFPFGDARIFVWSTPDVFDIDRRLAAEKEFELAADAYIPAIIFLRSAFGDQCWHNPSPGAGIVIDDPLLSRKYGFIDFRELLGSARKHQYHVTLAFIPWNHWRSRRRELQLFREHADCFGICAHGCDHTKNEFKVADYEGLLRKNFIARERMEQHRDRTGLGSAPIMVCPQEQYSIQAMRAFSDSRQFLGLVNTACMPRNLKAGELTGADLLWPAQDSFFGFPVFKRHYWNGMAIFAMALFLGKPAILVEHHEFFRNGPGGAEEFARGLAKLRPGLKWKSLADTLTRTHSRRRLSGSRKEVRFFTDTFFCEHELEYPIDYHLVRRIPEATVVQRVLVNEKEAPFNRANGLLTFETHADRPQTLYIQVEVAPIRSTQAYSSGVRYQASVAIRRGLSELRDNVVARNRFSLKLMKSLGG